MTVDDIRSQYSMIDVVKKYGFIPNRAGFISCPFHTKDKTPSLKVYKDSFYCFACGEHGDIFNFVEKIENVSFKEAFQILGGTYEKQDFKSKLAIYRSQKERERKERIRLEEEERLRIEKEENYWRIDFCRYVLKHFPPYSDTWCLCANMIDYELYKYDILNGIGG